MTMFATIILSPDQVLELARLVREHEPIDVHMAKSIRDGDHTIDVDMYRDDELHWRCTASITDNGCTLESVTKP